MPTILDGVSSQHDVPLVNLPNVLTTVRLVMIPVFLAALFADGGHDAVARWIAGAVFAAAAITDRYDGRIARNRGQVTDFGKIADPIADKALIGAALVGTSVLEDVYWWVTIVILGREMAITLLRLAVLRYGVIAASAGGKAKTLVQMFAIGFYVLPLATLPIPGAVVEYGRAACMGAAIVLTLATGIDYLVRAAILVSRERRAERAEST
jgi:CDP-diacylglycerol--glycerol-3-phosphate 3-phosphatidyltransferase